MTNSHRLWICSVSIKGDNLQSFDVKCKKEDREMSDQPLCPLIVHSFYVALYVLFVKDYLTTIYTLSLFFFRDLFTQVLIEQMKVDLYQKNLFRFLITGISFVD